MKVLFASTVLCLEAALLFFFGLAAWGLNQHQWYAWWLFGGACVLALACVAACALLQRPLGYAVGWALQILMIWAFIIGALLSGDGLIVPMAVLPGIGFITCWWYAVSRGEQIDREKMERYRLEEERAAEAGADSVNSEENPHE